MKITKVWDAADGSATPGRVFTGSIQQEVVPALGQQLDYMKLGVKGAISTAAVAIETFAGLINPFTLRKGAATRLVLALDELCALSVVEFGNRIAIGENTDNTGNNFLGDIRIPVYDKVDASNQFLVQADRVAQTNVATETVSLTGYFDTGVANKKPIHAVRVPHTTVGTAGVEQYGPKVPAVGTMRKIIIKVPNGFADGNIDTSVQRLRVFDDTSLIAEFNDLGDAVTLGDIDYVTPSPYADLMRQFRVFDFGETGIDTKKGTISLAFDVQDVSDSIVVIPVIDIETQGA